MELLGTLAATWVILFGLWWAFRKMTSPPRVVEVPDPPSLKGAVHSLPKIASEARIIAFIDSWVSLLEREDYEAAYAHTAHWENGTWSAELIRRVIKGYGQQLPTQRVTLAGRATDISQRKDVDRHEKPQSWSVGYIAYDLNLDGVLSDLTATFVIFEKDDYLAIVLEDIHVL